METPIGPRFNSNIVFLLNNYYILGGRDEK